MNENQQFELLDVLVIVSFVMQLMNQFHIDSQATNNELMECLHDIANQNARIINLLETSSDHSSQNT